MPDTWSNNELIGQLLKKLIKGDPGKGPLESASTVLYPKGAGKYDIEANTSEGLKVFKDAVASDELVYDTQSEVDDPLLNWIDAPVEDDERIHFGSRELPSTDQIFERLGSTSKLMRHRAIFDAELMSFIGEERTTLIDLLKNYIEQNRDSKDREELIVVSAAIRKCVALLEESDMEWLATLLEPGHRVKPSLDAQLEIAKMVVRRYSRVLPAFADPHPELSACLAAIASDYLRPYVFGQERFPTVAMLAIQSLIVMRSIHADSLIEQVNQLPFAWFRKQLVRRMNKLLKQMTDGVPCKAEFKNLITKIDLD